VSDAASDAVDRSGSSGRSIRHPGQLLACGWCGNPITVAAVGRTPTWCSASCRHRAWETRRAAASGRVAVAVVDRLVQVDRTVTVIERVEVASSPKGGGWVDALRELARQLDAGTVYDRDLPAVADSVDGVITALRRRPGLRGRR
jgi:hypothetical protein